MLVTRFGSRALIALAPCISPWFALSGCSSSTSTATAAGGSAVASAGGSTNDTAGTANMAGASGGAAPGGGSAGSAGSTTAGAPIGGNGTNAGAGGSAIAGATSGGGTAGAGGLEPGDTPPWRTLNVTAAIGEHVHGKAGLDTRAKPLGKLAVDIGVNSGGYSSWLAKRGYHSLGAPCGACPAPNLDGGRNAVGTCRLGEFATTEASVKASLQSLEQQYPEEDWGYFLNQDGSVRWSDVAITGMSHGATTAELAGRLGARMWRVVSRSGPRDNTCGNAGGVCTMPLSTPSYDPNCAPADIAAWLDMPSKTPMNRFYGLVGTTDVECGDIMFNMHYSQFVGVPVIYNTTGATLTGTNQFFSTEGGHLDFLNAANKPLNTDAVLEIAFAIPAENQHPNF